MGLPVRCEPRPRIAAEEPCRHRVSDCGGTAVSVRDATTVFLLCLEAATALPWSRDHPSDCRSLAYYGPHPQPALLRLDAEELARTLSRVPMVLLHQRAAS